MINYQGDKTIDKTNHPLIKVRIDFFLQGNARDTIVQGVKLLSTPSKSGMVRKQQ